MSETIELKRDFANITDATSMALVALGFRSRRLRDFICGLQGVAGARREFDCTHLKLARRLDHNGRDEAAELFVTRYLAALEKEQKRVGRYLFKVERGGGIEHKPTHYVDYITPAAIWATRQARQSALWKESHTNAIADFIPAAIEMLPLIEEEESDEMQPDPYHKNPGVQIARNESHALTRIRANLNTVRENGGSVVDYAEHFIAKFTADIRERAYLAQHGLEGEGISFDTLVDTESHKNLSEPSTLLAAALNYAQHGIPVFPVRRDKRPYTQHGFKDAICDEETIREWWAKWSDANIGIPTGVASGWLVLDVDPRHGGDASLSELKETHGEIPETLEQKTGGDGNHIIFENPELTQIGNSRGRLPEGLDIRGDGGYIVAAPSVHESGRQYEWLNDVTPAPVPEWLLAHLTEEKHAILRPMPGSRAATDSIPLDGAPIIEGQRNHWLFRRVACSLAGKGASLEEIEAGVMEANARACSPPLDASECLKIARSAHTMEMRKRVATVGA